MSSSSTVSKSISDDLYTWPRSNLLFEDIDILEDLANYGEDTP